MVPLVQCCPLIVLPLHFDRIPGLKFLLPCLVLIILQVEALGEGPVDELVEEDLTAAVLVDGVELCNVFHGKNWHKLNFPE